MAKSSELKQLEKITATKLELYQIVLECLAISKNSANSFQPGEMPSNSASHQALNYVQSF